MPISPRSSILGIILIGLFAWLPGVCDAAFVWDDDLYVTENESLLSLEAFGHAILHPRDLPQYYPVTHLSFFVERSLFGENAQVFRATNMLLHIASAILLFLLLLRLQVPGALFAALIFSVHPVMIESVLWITERKNTLSLFFMLLTLRQLLRADDGPSRRDLIFGFLFFVAALLSKSVACACPAVYLLLRHLMGRLKGRDIKLMLPFFALGLVAASFTSYLEQEHVGAIGREWDFSILERSVIAGRALFFYVSKLIFPWPITFNYERWQIGTGLADLAWPLAALLVTALLLLFRKRMGRGPVVALFIYGGLLLPALGFINIYPMRYSFVADHFQYHASPAILALVAAMLQSWKSLPEKLRLGTQILLLLGLLSITWAKTPAWSSPEALWQDCLKWNSTSFLAHHNLGDLQRASGDWENALFSHRAALSCRPDLSSLWTEVAIDLENLGQAEAALEHFETARQRTPEDPKFRLNLAQAYLRRGRAEDSLNEILALNAPDQSRPLVQAVRGAALMALKRYSEALQDLQAAAGATSASATDYLNLSLVTERLRGPQAAIAVLPERGDVILEIRRAELLLQLGQYPTAFAITEKLLHADGVADASSLYFYLLLTRRQDLSPQELKEAGAVLRSAPETSMVAAYRNLARACLSAREDDFDSAMNFARLGLADAEKKGNGKDRALFQTILSLFSRQQIFYLW